MENKKWTRRQILGSLAAMPLAAREVVSPFSKAALSSFSRIQQGNSKMIKCKLLSSDGKPFEVNKMSRFYICDLLSRPFQIHPQFSPGEIAFVPASEPFRISLPVMVPGFGEVFLYADNRGTGYTAASLAQKDVLFLNYEFAADRLATVTRHAEECRSSGINLSSKVLERITAAEKDFAQCKKAIGDDQVAAKWTMESLRESLYAGEMIVIERAQHQIEKRGARPGFLYGCNAFRFRDYGSPYTKLFEDLFNFATLPFYMTGTQKAKGQLDYSGLDPLLEAFANTSIISKGHPLIFLVPQSPEWIRNIPFKEVKKACIDYIKASILRFRDRIHVWDVINEAHVQPDVQYGNAMIPDYTKEQTIELSIAAAKAAREADPTCFRIVNSTGTWADYYMGKPAEWQQTPYDYLTMLKNANCDYEAIGLQYYHSGRDLLEFERDVERFAGFGKPIHITELQIPSSSEEIPGKDWWGGGVGGAGLNWHGDNFTETIQADWAVGVYTILFSKPYIDAVTWWDMSDPAFVPHGGIVTEDNKPKESYYRLKKLFDQWKSM